VEKGVLMTYLHNSTTAKRHGVESTANAGLISPSAFNLVIGEGDGQLEEMIAGVEKGIYVTNDWYLRYQNWRTGDFSAIPRDAMFLIEDGEMTRPIKEMRISDNVLRILAGVKQLTREREWVKWWEVDTPTLTPSALISRIRFTRSTM
jgi:PmbA protein